MYRKVAAVWVSLLIIVSSIVILVEIAERVEAPTTLYVGGGPGNYSKIQWAIDNASDGDTVFVFNGTYYENVIVNKTINLTGENRDTTVIYGMGSIKANLVNITGFTVSKSGSAGLHLDDNYITIFGNNISSNLDDGIYITGRGNTIFDNIISNNSIGISLSDSRENVIMNNRFSDWISLDHSIKNEISGNDFENASIHLQNSEENKIINNIFLEGFIVGYESGKNIIIGNNITNSSGIYLNLDLGMNEIIQNNIVNCTRGIYLDLFPFSGTPGPCNITNNIISSNSDDGIYIAWTGGNNIINNHIASNNGTGIYLYWSSVNNIKGNQIIYNQGSGIGLSSSGSNNITENNVSYNLYSGIAGGIVGGNDIFSNIISNNNDTGMDFYESSGNKITNNLISNHNCGISFTGEIITSGGNMVFHNSLINNSIQAVDVTNGTDIWPSNYWDDGYPSGGNYWSDYNGFDNYKGPNQDIIGSDGIGDTKYDIDINSFDNYPLIKPIDNYIVLKLGWNLISIPLIQDNPDLSRVLEMIDSYYDAVQWFDITDQINPWNHYKIGKPFGNHLFELNETMSFWIHITQPGETIFLYNGTQPTSNLTIQLHPGWNMVGYPSLTSHNRTTGLNNLTFDTHVDAIQWYDAGTKTWNFMDQDDSFVPGRGYWVHSKVKTTWEVPL
jgi:parallel beta-helix repeat protein